MNFAVLWLYAKVSSAKFGVWHPSGQQKQAIRESCLREDRIFHQFAKVLSLKVSRYTVFFFRDAWRV